MTDPNEDALKRIGWQLGTKYRRPDDHIPLSGALENLVHRKVKQMSLESSLAQNLPQQACDVGNRFGYLR